MDSSLNSLDMNVDPYLQSAVQEAKTTKTITPLIKQELKYTILNRRHKNGEGDIVLQEKKPAIKQELTEEECKKKLRRKDQNRRAAHRCRQKKKVLADKVVTDYLGEQQKNEVLQNEIDELKKQKKQLQRLLDEHALVCTRPLTPTPTYDDQTTFSYPPYMSCPTPSTYVSESPYVRETSTPNLQEPFDDVFSAVAQYMYPTGSDMSQKNYTHPATCTMTTADLPELDLTDDFQVFQPCSPELQLGRQSISEYPEYMEEDVMFV